MPVFDSSSLTTYTDQDMVLIYRDAIVKVASGQSYTINGRTMTRANLQELQETLAFWEMRATADGNGLGMGTATVQFAGQAPANNLPMGTS